MTAHGSQGQQSAVAFLLMFVLLWFFWTLNSLISTVPPWGPPLNSRVLYVLIADVLVLVAVARYLKTWSVLWQLPMQALALVLLFTGVRGIVRALFRDLDILVAPPGLWYGGCIAAAALLGVTMRRLQWQFLDGRHRHLTIGSGDRGPRLTKNHKPGSLGSTVDELKRGTFFANARSRSSRRKSPWNLLLLLALPLWIGLLVEGIKLARTVALLLLHGRAIPADLIWPSAIAPFFVYFPMLIATMLTSMLLINYAVYLLVPPARRAMDAEDKAVPGTEYATQQPLMVRLTAIILPIAFLLAVAGEIFL
jgi:hypothetical protein